MKMKSIAVELSRVRGQLVHWRAVQKAAADGQVIAQEAIVRLETARRALEGALDALAAAAPKEKPPSGEGLA